MPAWNYPAPPKRLKVLHRTFKVRPFTAEEAAGAHADSWAFINTHRGDIGLDPDLTPCAALESLLHEIAHGIWQSFLRSAEQADQEDVAIAMGQGFAAVLKDNPRLRAWIDEVAKA